jgi:hypothetical protein
MSTDPLPDADPADVAEQDKETVPPAGDEEFPADDSDELPVEANEADVVEQNIDVPGWGEDEGDES